MATRQHAAVNAHSAGLLCDCLPWVRSTAEGLHQQNCAAAGMDSGNAQFHFVLGIAGHVPGHGMGEHAGCSAEQQRALAILPASRHARQGAQLASSSVPGNAQISIAKTGVPTAWCGPAGPSVLLELRVLPVQVL